jgi:hypothetical protein
MRPQAWLRLTCRVAGVALALLRSCSCHQEQEHRGRVQHRDEDEPPQRVLAAGDEQRRQIAHRAKVGLDLPTIAFQGSSSIFSR